MVGILIASNDFSMRLNNCYCYVIVLPFLPPPPSTAFVNANYFNPDELSSVQIEYRYQIRLSNKMDKEILVKSKVITFVRMG